MTITTKASAKVMRQHAMDKRSTYPLANAPLQIVSDSVRESLTLHVRGILGGPYARHDERCLRFYGSTSTAILVSLHRRDLRAELAATSGTLPLDFDDDTRITSAQLQHHPPQAWLET